MSSTLFMCGLAYLFFVCNIGVPNGLLCVCLVVFNGVCVCVCFNNASVFVFVSFCLCSILSL